MDILADLIAQLSPTVLFKRSCPCSYQVPAVPRNINVDEPNNMLFEFLWFHITSCIFSHRYVIPKTLLIPRLTLIKTWFGPCQPYDGRYYARPCDTQDENPSLLYFKLFVL